MGVNRLIVLNTNPLRATIGGNDGIIKIMNLTFVFCILYFYFSLETEPEALRSSETLVAGLGLVLAILQPETMTVCRL